LTQENLKFIFDRYFNALRSYVYYRFGDEDEATDIAQEAFILLWEKNADFEEKRNLKFLYTVAGNMSVDRYRKHKSAQKYLTSLKWSWSEEYSGNEIEFGELKHRYETALLQMPEDQRVTFLMSRNDELTYSEIAQRLNISVKAVEKRMSKALALLNQKIGNG